MLIKSIALRKDGNPDAQSIDADMTSDAAGKRKIVNRALRKSRLDKSKPLFGIFLFLKGSGSADL